MRTSHLIQVTHQSQNYSTEWLAYITVIMVRKVHNDQSEDHCHIHYISFLKSKFTCENHQHLSYHPNQCYDHPARKSPFGQQFHFSYYVFWIYYQSITQNRDRQIIRYGQVLIVLSSFQSIKNTKKAVNMENPKVVLLPQPMCSGVSEDWHRYDWQTEQSTELVQLLLALSGILRSSSVCLRDATLIL